MKKIISILISVILLAAFALNAGAAGMQVSCDASSETVKKGSEVTFTVSVSGAEAANAALIEVSYSAGFEIVSGQWLKSDALMTDFNGEDGVIAFASATNLNGNLFKLVLKAKENADSKQSVTASVTLKNGSSDAGSNSATKSVTLKSNSQSTVSSNASTTTSSKSSGKGSNSKGTKNTTTVSKTNEQADEITEQQVSEETATTTESSSISSTASSVDSISTETDSSKNSDNGFNPLWLVLVIGALAVICVIVIIIRKRR